MPACHPSSLSGPRKPAEEGVGFLLVGDPAGRTALNIVSEEGIACAERFPLSLYYFPFLLNR